MDRGIKGPRSNLKLDERPVELHIHTTPRKPFTPKPDEYTLLPEPEKTDITKLLEIEEKKETAPLPTISIFSPTVKKKPVKSHFKSKEFIFAKSKNEEKPIVEPKIITKLQPKEVKPPETKNEIHEELPQLMELSRIPTVSQKVAPKINRESYLVKTSIKSKKPPRKIRKLEKRLNKASSRLDYLKNGGRSRVYYFAKNTRKKMNKSFAIKTVAGLTVIGILALTGYISYDTWQTNNQIRQTFANTKSSNIKILSPNFVADESSSKTTASSTDGKTTSVLGAYSVASDLPKAIYISKINVSAKLLPMGINSDNSLQAPTNASDAGWFTGSAKPGQPGAIVVDGHASETGTHYGLFGYLDTVGIGDQIVIEKGDGTKFTFAVVHTETIPYQKFDMNKILKPYGDDKQGLNIITCTGHWTSDKQTLDQRLLVYSVLINTK